MQRIVHALVIIVASYATAVHENPVGNVVQLLSLLEATIEADGMDESKVYEGILEWCDDTSTDTELEINKDSKETGQLELTIAKSIADVQAEDAARDAIGKAISTSIVDVEAATKMHDKEHDEFAKNAAQIVDSIKTLNRAIDVVGFEMEKHPAFVQRKINTADAQAVLQSLSMVLDSAALSGADLRKLVVLVQEDVDDRISRASQATSDKSQVSSIVDILKDLREKATEELAEARQAESHAQSSFNTLKLSLSDKISADSPHQLSQAESSRSSDIEARASAAAAAYLSYKSSAEGDLARTVKDLDNAKVAFRTVITDCKAAAENHEASMKSRTQEFKTISKAKKIIVESTDGAQDQVYSEGKGSLLEVNQAPPPILAKKIVQSTSSAAVEMHPKWQTHLELVSIQLVTMIKHLAMKHHSRMLTHLASRIGAVVHGWVVGEDPFAKVRELITQAISKLKAEYGVDSKHKAHCDEMKKTADKTTELQANIDKFTSNIDKAFAESAKLKEQIFETQQELAELMKAQVQVEVARKDGHIAFVKAKADLVQGIKGVQQALLVLRNYYGSTSFIQDQNRRPEIRRHISSVLEVPTMHSKANDVGSSIIGILEVISSDFSKSLAKETAAEEEAESTYKQTMQEDKVSASVKEQDVKYMTAKVASLDEVIADNASDREKSENQLSTMWEYSDWLVERCAVHPKTGAERKKRYETEIDGLQEALTYFSHATLLQKQERKSRHLRHTLEH